MVLASRYAKAAGSGWVGLPQESRRRPWALADSGVSQRLDRRICPPGNQRPTDRLSVAAPLGRTRRPRTGSSVWARLLAAAPAGTRPLVRSGLLAAMYANVLASARSSTSEPGLFPEALGSQTDGFSTILACSSNAGFVSGRTPHPPSWAGHFPPQMVSATPSGRNTAS